MFAGMPYKVKEWAMHIHPVVAEFFSMLRGSPSH
jgi:hypothetical protein